MGGYLTLLSLIVFLPAAAALLIAFIPSKQADAIRYVTLSATVLVVLLIILGILLPGTFDTGVAEMQDVFNVSWIPSFNIEYFMGLDGISLPLIVLTGFVSLLAMAASWSITKYVKGYCILFLLLVTGMLGVFMALDFFLFYVFWEVMLLPMYFLIGVWGGPRKEYAAIKFFLYTLAGSIMMLIAILMLYFNSNLVELAAQSNLNDPEAAAAVDWESLHLRESTTESVKAELAKPVEDQRPIHTFNLIALAKMGQHTACFSRGIQIACFVLLFIGFAIKVPSVPVHTWLPDAHVEAPTPISMILAGVLLKMGGYGIIRICYPICPWGGYDLAFWVCLIGVVSMIYGAFAALAQKDFKRLVAYSSVSHMGYVVLGLGVWSATAGNPIGAYDSSHWNMGMQGAMFQMIAHGVSSAGMFFMVGVIYDRVHHRNLNEFGGLFGKMPVYTALSIGIFFAALGLPGLCGFIGELLVMLSVWNYMPALAILSAATVILTATYILWTIQRVYLGHKYKGPHEEELKPITGRELAVAVPIFAFAILLGVFPYRVPFLGNMPSVLRYMEETVNQQATDLADWTQRVPDGLPTEDFAADTREHPQTVKVSSPKADRNERAQAKTLDGTAPITNVTHSRPRDSIPID